ncbi:PTS N-acetylmuramic acid transporter subunit IIBC [Testudinibacter sp. TR-2022]|uniref:PTS N-acetylmuramic acid transporter subunit IIBC n=1 Tax=Testudinibacter sp. TR-2022 TaxID=2585029 RepID=UPI00111A7D61|nr:PTS N-acetylmuramic acid transporter subunit IIBC [Testudinibacter sp. TR-2022]TNH03884.1 PTS N-acetylmuramic acid transporter subunit IIBC [Pasteurellaceae bacterium Phil31]TNH07680.1 PTS N-acetylmuramic acid transporter subunit IIBC [Testudinibacter sp. TR-2022]TNH08774.1 PTS N-acetylmuramic acid transporter subunit IIBC [Testudinibacter sp. TR-2022]TNH10786.1 PTS N-acetylmuramic acid transporter subunit IIBC [Testudinibacter sp. TR-2022]TNH18376.1 PTS N-acetylmuramic acid transporter sub
MAETKQAAGINPAFIAQVVTLLGGAENIASVGNCMTRLRLKVNQPQAVELEKLKRLEAVMGVVNMQDQVQIILGPGKAGKAAELCRSYLQQSALSHDLNDIAQSNKQQLKQQQSSGMHQFLSKFATIFTPLIPGFIGAGLLLGIGTLLDQSFVAGVEAPNATLVALIGYLKVFSKGLFSFLSIMIGYNAAKAFGGTGVNGAIIASFFILGYNPEATKGIYSGMSSFFGLEIDPRGNIIGVLIAAIVGAKIEQWVRKFIPDNLDMLLTSTITLLMMGAFTFLLIMPLGVVLFNGMSWLFSHLNGNPFGSAVLAGLFLLSVMFGIHQGFVPVYFALVETQGFNALFPILAMAGAGQVGAAIALYVMANKSSLLRSQIKGAILPGFLGIGEPLIYGVTLPRVKPFITACIGGAAGGFVIGLIAYLGFPMGLNSVFGPSGLLAIPLLTGPNGVFAAIAIYLAGTITAYLVGFVTTYFFAKEVDLS